MFILSRSTLLCDLLRSLQLFGLLPRARRVWANAKSLFILTNNNPLRLSTIVPRTFAQENGQKGNSTERYLSPSTQAPSKPRRVRRFQRIRAIAEKVGSPLGGGERGHSGSSFRHCFEWESLLTERLFVQVTERL